MVITAGVFVTAKKDGRDQNVTYPSLSVNFPAARTMVDASRVTATVSGAGRDYTANNRTVLIHHARAMVPVYLANATVKQDGKVKTVASSISRCINVFRPAPIMGRMI